MAIFAISDLHLSLNGDKPMDIFGSKWDNYVEKMSNNWNSVVTDDDLVIIPGDISWAMYLQDTTKDLEYINSLNGRKVLIRGNHDYWWTTLNKMEKFILENKFDTISFLKNTAFIWEDTAICGTRGWNIADENSSEDDKKIYQRERQRIVLSLEDARMQKPKSIIVAMHYPPKENNSVSSGFMDILENYNVEQCVFGHLHGGSHKNAPTGDESSIKLRLVACDYTDFTPVLIKK